MPFLLVIYDHSYRSYVLKNVGGIKIKIKLSHGIYKASQKPKKIKILISKGVCLGMVESVCI